mgnify:FL=1
MQRIVKMEGLTAQDKAFIKNATWSAGFQNNNLTGYRFDLQEGETSQDAVLYVIEGEEDIRHIRGGSWHEWGTCYGMASSIASTRFPITWEGWEPIGD